MSFLQPAMLLAIPVVALPIVIHLINQRRFQTVHWAAIQFLIAANRMSRGYARIRRWLILAARTIAIAGLIFAISRPLSSGLLGLAGGGRVDTTIILLDRSPSMMQRGGGGQSKLRTGIDQLTDALEMLRSSRYVLIDSADVRASEVDAPEVILDLPWATAVSQSADIPAMLEEAGRYIRENRPSRCEVWICSDVRKHDWKQDSGRWEAIRSSLAELPQMVRFHLLAYPDTMPENRSIRLTEVRRVEDADGPGLLLSLRVHQSVPVDDRMTVPIQLEINGARSELTAELTGTELELRNYAVPIDGGKTPGWGKISIASDANPSDNEYFFVYDEPVRRRTVIVADDPDRVRPLQLAASIPPEPKITCTTKTLSPDQLVGTPLDDVSLLLWQSALPSADDILLPVVEAFLRRGGQIIFFPPSSPTDAAFAGLRWGDWQEQAEASVTTWLGDQDLLSKTRSGASLPVGQLKVTRRCQLQGDAIALATLGDSTPLLARAMADQRNVYFCTTTASPDDSTLAADGVVLYAMIHRALAAGADSLAGVQQFVAGQAPSEDSQQWAQLAGDRLALSNSYTRHAGVYQQGDRLLAINRSEAEDTEAVVSREQVARLFDGLDFDRVDDRAGSGDALIQEIWRLFLIGMLLALVLEAVLCIPRRQGEASGVAA